MDPDAALSEAERALELVLSEGADTVPDEANALAQAFDALNSWIQRGGFLPAKWERR